MSPQVNIADINFATEYDIDKIVGIYQGSFNAATQTTPIVYTFISSPYTVWYYEIPHQFGQPIFCEVLTSTDNITFTNTASIAFSDSSTIYIYAGQGIAPTGIIYYKLVASWITGYSILTPSITPVIQGTSSLYYSSIANSQKIFLDDVVPLVNNTTTNIPHNLGYYPNCKVFMECFTGQVWPCHTGGSSDVFFFADNENTGYFNITTSNIEILCDQRLASFGPSRFWYRIYLDS